MAYHAIWDPETVINTFTRHPVYDRIFAHMTPASLIAMGRVNRLTRRAVQDYSRRSFSVNRLLRRFFSDPIAFRSFQARTATLISGSFVVQFFDRSFYPESDLDLYPYEQHICELGAWLEREGYVFMPSSFQPKEFRQAADHEMYLFDVDENADLMPLDIDHQQRYLNGSLSNVYTFMRPATDQYNPVHPAKVQIIKSKYSPLHCILDFHSTCVMNIITYNAAISLYPYTTYEQHAALAIGGDERQAPAIAKYARRGWKMISPSSPLIFSSSPESVTFADHFHIKKLRWVDDKHSWVIQLNMDQVSEPPALSPSSTPLTWDPVTQNSWVLSAEKGELVERSHWMTHRKADTRVLYYPYTVGDSEYLYQLVPFFLSQGKFEYAKLGQDGWTETSSDVWTWWDSVLPVFRANYTRRLEIEGRLW